MTSFFRKLSWWMQRRRKDDELREELQFHLEEEADALHAEGLSQDHARWAARRDLGNPILLREETRTLWTWTLLEQAAQDVRYALRGLRRSPGFAVVAVVTLALGIGANTAIFTLLDGVMLKPLDVTTPHELQLLQIIDEEGPDPQLGIGPKARFSHLAFQRFVDALPPETTLAAMSRMTLFHVRFGGATRVRATQGQLVSAEYFSLLRVRASHGRLLDQADNRQIDAHPVAVISHTLWRELGSSGSIIGQPISVNGVPITIVGVAEAGFRGVWADKGTELWLPVSMQHALGYRQNYSVSRGQYNAPWLTQNGVTWLTLVARVPDEQRRAFAAATDAAYRADLLAQAEALNIPPERLALALKTRRLLRTPFEHGLSTLRQQFASPLYLLMSLVALVLVVACVNVANLLLARGMARTREIGVRLSLGASRLRLARQMMVESLVLAFAGGAVGVAFGVWLSHSLASLAGVDSILVDTRVLAFSVAVTAATAMLFGVAPALRATRVDPSRVIASSSKGVTASFDVARMRPLVSAQMAVTFVMVTGAVLFGRSLGNLANIDPGFDRDQLVALSFNPVASGYAREEVPALQRRLLERVRTQPGIAAAAVSFCPLAAGCRNSQTVSLEDYQPAPDERVQVQVTDVGADYFTTVGMDLLEGRAIDARDIASAAAVVVINESTARRYFGGRSPVGRRLARGSGGPFRFEIVGLVRDARTNDLAEEPVPTVFVPLVAEAPGPWVIHARVIGDPQVAMRDLRESINRSEPGLLIERSMTIEGQLQQNLTEQRLVAYLATAVGALTLLLACIGLYGVVSYGVARRTSEIGVRLTFGAKRSDIVRQVIAEGGLTAGVGLAAGALLALWATRFVGAMLYDVSPTEPTLYLLVAAGLVASVVLACLVPAGRAACVDPVQALRAE
jgi:predicted permease